MKIFATEKEMYAFKRACVDLGFGGVGRDIGLSSSTIHKIFKAGMQAEVRAVNIRQRVLDEIAGYLPLADQKAIAAKPAPPVNELGMARNPPSFDRPTVEVDKKSFIRQGIDFYLDEFDDRQLAKALCFCTEIRAESSTIGA